jgi:hypothetical protein
MQIHLFERTSQDPMVRQMGNHNLSLCMLAMDELGKIYIAAVAAHRLFEAAIQKVEETQQRAEAAASAIHEEGGSDVTHAAGLGTWPDGYWTTAADVITDVWTPWNSGMGIQ